MYKNLGSEKSKCVHEGCSKQLKEEQLQKHEINCGYRKISCPLSVFKKCSEEIRIKDAMNHLREHKTKTKADWDLDLGLNFILYEMIYLKYIICLHMHQVACRDKR